MRTREGRSSASWLLAAGAVLAASVPAPGATLRDIAALAGDLSSTVPHNEPSIAVNPLNPNQIAVIDFSGNWGPSSNAPVWKSDDGGTSWRKVAQIPQPAAGHAGPADQKIAFDRNGHLYVAAAALDSMIGGDDYVFRQNGAPDAVMAVGALYGDDQPHLDLDKAPGSPCLDQLYSPWLNTRIPNNQSNVESSANFGAAVAAVAVGTIASVSDRTTRIALAPDGKAYVVYKARTGSGSGDFEGVHFNVKRSDDCGTTWNGLSPGDVSVTGATLVQTYFTDFFGAGTVTQRALSSDAWIAAHPVTGDVYVSYVSRDASGFAQIYVARSATQGATWTSARVTDGTHNSAFPEVAVTHHGTIGVLYLDYDTSGGVTTYRHRFARSGDQGAHWSDQILQSMDPTGFPNLESGLVWGDYEGLTAAGTSFYGAFTGASIGRPAPQLDTIFFRETELPAGEDFYVRDWTGSAASHDDGAEPSTHADFFSSSDVWNRRSNTTGTLAGGVPPEQENPWDAALGHNFAFARVSRNGAGPAKTVTAHFLYADYGMGSNFTAAAAASDPILPFAAGETQRVSDGYSWDLPAVHSQHVCMAVEISSTDGSDPLLPPDLTTTAPGPGDPLVLNDNNKAQRNMAIYPSLGELATFAIVHNPGVRTETLRLDFKTTARGAPPRVRVIAPDHPEDRSERVVLKAGSALSLADMRPGENRWIEITAAPGAAVLVEQRADGHVVNGFGLTIQAATVAEMIAGNTLIQTAALHRAAALRLGSVPESLGKRGLVKLSAAQYLAFTAEALKVQQPAVKALLAEGNPLGLDAATASLAAALAGKDPSRVAAAHAAFLHRLDAALTLHQKSRGEPADVPQTVRFQRELFSTVLAGRPRAAEIAERSRRFLETWSRKPVDAASYLELLRATLPDLAADAGDGGDLATLQRRHLLHLWKLAGSL